MTWSQPRTWVAGETVGAATMNAHIRDNLNHLYDSVPPGLAGSGDIAGVGGGGTSEEWDSAVTGLTWNNSPTTVDSNTSMPSFLYIQNQADTTERFGTKSWAPAGAFDARLGHIIFGSNSTQAAVDASFGFHIGDSGNNNRLLIQAVYTCSTASTSIYAYTFAAASYTQRGNTVTVSSSVPLYFNIVRDGSNNCSFYWSLNGRLWNYIATQTLALTVANIGVRVIGNATAPFQAAADFLRTDV